MSEGYKRNISKTYTHALQKPKLTSFVIFAGVAMALLLAAPIVRAATYNEQINQLKQQNATSKSQQQNLALSAGTLADKIAGIQAGDVITKLAGKPINTIYDYMEVLGEHEKGQQVEAEFLRGTERKVVKVTF